MSRRNRIIVSSEPNGKFKEGYVAAGQTHYPGMICTRDASVALKGGNHTYKTYAETADGDIPTGPYWVVCEDLKIGKTMSDSYAAGELVQYYCPRAGDELNLLIKNLAGTADDHPLGEKLMVDHLTGKLIVSTGTPKTIVAELLETITDPVVDTLGWCVWSGY